MYRKIPTISPGLKLISVQKAFFAGLISGELIFGGAYYRKEFWVSKWVCLDNKNTLRADLHGTTLSHAINLRQVYDMNRFV